MGREVKRVQREREKEIKKGQGKFKFRNRKKRRGVGGERGREQVRKREQLMKNVVECSERKKGGQWGDGGGEST